VQRTLRLRSRDGLQNNIIYVRINTPRKPTHTRPANNAAAMRRTRYLYIFLNRPQRDVVRNSKQQYSTTCIPGAAADVAAS